MMTVNLEPRQKQKQQHALSYQQAFVFHECHAYSVQRPALCQLVQLKDIELPVINLQPLDQRLRNELTATSLIHSQVDDSSSAGWAALFADDAVCVSANDAVHVF